VILKNVIYRTVHTRIFLVIKWENCYGTLQILRVALSDEALS